MNLHSGDTVFYPLSYIAFSFLVAGLHGCLLPPGTANIHFVRTLLLSAGSGVAVPVLLNGTKNNLDTGAKCLCSVVRLLDSVFGS